MGVRPFSKGDLPQVAQLHQKVFSRDRGDPSDELKTYLRGVFLEHPWYGDGPPSLVYEEDHSGIVGFLGVIPGRMMMRGRPIRVAVGSQFMVDPDSRSTFGGVKLLRALFSGPQELSMTDGANAMARRLWETFGGVSVPIYSIYWTRVLRPCQHAVELLWGPANRLRVARAALRPLCRGADEIEAHVRSNGMAQTCLPFEAEAEDDPAKICEAIARLSANTSLRPHYDPDSLRWLLCMAAQKRKWGPLRNEVLRGADGQIVGWYLYYLNVDGISQVLQLAALPHTISGVLNHLFHSVWRQGSTAVSGRMEPRYLHELYHRGCRFTCGSAMLVQSKDPDILRALYTGDAFLTRLEGEWWNRFSELMQ
jgi:hypothetical protein